jgi:hypothetical protein
MSDPANDIIVRDIVAEVVDLKMENSKKVGSKKLPNAGVGSGHGSISPAIRKRSDSISSHDNDDSYDEDSDINGHNHKEGFFRKQHPVKERFFE